MKPTYTSRPRSFIDVLPKATDVHMSPDPIIEEVRQVRREIEAECQNDPEKYYRLLLDVQEQYRDRLVRRGPVRVRTTEEEAVEECPQAQDHSPPRL